MWMIDSLAVFGTKTYNIHDFMSMLNYLFSSMKFTLEIENEDQLLSQDVFLYHIVPIWLEFDEFRKDAHIHRSIPNNLHHSGQQK